MVTSKTRSWNKSLRAHGPEETCHFSKNLKRRPTLSRLSPNNVSYKDSNGVGKRALKDSPTPLRCQGCCWGGFAPEDKILGETYAGKHIVRLFTFSFVQFCLGW